MASDPGLPPASEGRALLVAHVDFTGRLRGRVVPHDRVTSALTSGVTYNKANLNLDLRDHLPPAPILAASLGDHAAVGIAGTWRPHPTDGSLGVVFSHLAELDGRPWSACPRSALERQVGRLERLGIRAIVGFEQEGYLLDATSDDPIGSRGFSAAGSLRELGPFRDRLLAAAATAGVPLLQFSKEMGPHQYEVNLPPREPLTAAEDLVIAREAAHGVAAELRHRTTFMPKPWTDEPSSGLHVHLSLHATTGGNVVVDRDDPTTVSAVARHGVAGILAHARAIAAVTMPTLNSGRRLQPGQWTPVLGAWSPDERDALVRWTGSGEDRRVEFRGADACANPYLLLVVLLGSIADGVEAGHDLDPDLRIDAPVDIATVAAWRGAGRAVLPRSPGEGADALEADPAILEMLGEPIAPVMLQLRRAEQAMADAQVGPWERDLLLRQV